MDSKQIEFYSLVKDDVILTTSNRTYKFVKFGRKNFIGERDGVLYRVSNVSFREIVSRAPIVVSEKEEWYASLKAGDYFYIVKRSHCLVFKFKGIVKKRIVAYNPHNNLEVFITLGFEGGKLPVEGK